MNTAKPHILLLEPYYGGSHRAFLTGLQKHLPYRFTLVSLPARKWKMRMQLAAPWMAEEIIKLVVQGKSFDAILCSTFIDMATLRVILFQNGVNIPLAVYFHENQFAYPNQLAESALYQFSALNFTSALAADAVAFNSTYNLETFLEGVEGYLKKAIDMDVSSWIEELRKKSVVLYPGIDFENFGLPGSIDKDEVPVIVWNHRWEHDKDPETFFRTLMSMSLKGVNFRLIVLGQHFSHCPDIFDTAREELKDHIIHFGYVPNRREYIQLLHKGDIIVSTAIHEFFGMAVLEAVRCGCRPLVPDRLSYRELFLEEFRYGEGELAEAMTSLVTVPHPLKRGELKRLAEPYSWQNMTSNYQEWLEKLLRSGPHS